MQSATRKSLQLFFLLQLLLGLIGLGAVFVGDWRARGWVWLLVGTLGVVAYVMLLLIQTYADPPTLLFPKPTPAYQTINSVPAFVKTEYFMNVSAVVAIFFSSLVLVVGMNPSFLSLYAWSQRFVELPILLGLAAYNLWILWKMQK